MTQEFYRENYTDFEWFVLLKELGEKGLPNEYVDIFDREGEISEDYTDLFNIDIYQL